MVGEPSAGMRQNKRVPACPPARGFHSRYGWPCCPRSALRPFQIMRRTDHRSYGDPECTSSKHAVGRGDATSRSQASPTFHRRLARPAPYQVGRRIRARCAQSTSSRPDAARFAPGEHRDGSSAPLNEPALSSRRARCCPGPGPVRGRRRGGDDPHCGTESGIASFHVGSQEGCSRQSLERRGRLQTRRQPGPASR